MMEIGKFLARFRLSLLFETDRVTTIPSCRDAQVVP